MTRKHKSRKSRKKPPAVEGFSLAEVVRRMDPQRRVEIRRGVLMGVLAASLIIGTVVMAGELERRWLAGRVGPGWPEYDVVLVGLPAWLPAPVVSRLHQQLTPDMAFSDPQLTREVYNRAMADPWIRSVEQVRKLPPQDGGPARVQVTVEVRRPLAVVREIRGEAFVDAEGVVLPYHEVPRWLATRPTPDAGRRGYTHPDEAPPASLVEKIHYIAVEGVAAPAPAVAEAWAGEDLADALRLIGLLLDRPYGDQIAVVDVRNHHSHEYVVPTEPGILIWAPTERVRTRIIFGRFAREVGDWEIPTERKLAYLDAFAQDHGGRIAGMARRMNLTGDQLSYDP